MRAAPLKSSLRIAGPAGALELLLEEPARGDQAHFGVICHPHPLHGGTLDNKVVHTLARALHELGVPTLRFNFRGVGASEGEFAHGRGETQDALAVVDFGLERWPAATPWLLGFSFGGVVALRAAVQCNARLLVTVAPAVDRMEPESAMPGCPWLIVQGDADDVVDASRVLAWAQSLTPPPLVHVLPQASHFFHGRLGELRDVVVQFAAGSRQRS
ncbi:MAG TPA: alpha/beta fold hydrolase [Steroidobacteraceae bacterium]|nr:alpha/beta fold hydrolase [Steroidobacteraceae bacterium]